MQKEIKGFVAYPSNPGELGTTIESACSLTKNLRPFWKLHPWRANDIAGYCLSDPIIEKIEGSNLVIADVTKLNFNVAYEIGYAIGKQKRVFLIRNRSIVADERLLRDVGLFDTLGYEESQPSHASLAAKHPQHPNSQLGGECQW